MNYKILARSMLKATCIVSIILSGTAIIILASWKFMDWLKAMGIDPLACWMIAMLLLFVMPVFIGLIRYMYAEETKKLEP